MKIIIAAAALALTAGTAQSSRLTEGAARFCWVTSEALDAAVSSYLAKEHRDVQEFIIETFLPQEDLSLRAMMIAVAYKADKVRNGEETLRDQQMEYYEECYAVAITQ